MLASNTVSFVLVLFYKGDITWTDNTTTDSGGGSPGDIDRKQIGIPVVQALFGEISIYYIYINKRINSSINN